MGSGLGVAKNEILIRFLSDLKKKDTYLPNGLNMKAKNLFTPHSISKLVPRRLWNFLVSHNPLISHLHFWLIQIIGKCFLISYEAWILPLICKKLDFWAKKYLKNFSAWDWTGDFSVMISLIRPIHQKSLFEIIAKSIALSNEHAFMAFC